MCIFCLKQINALRLQGAWSTKGQNHPPLQVVSLPVVAERCGPWPQPFSWCYPNRRDGGWDKRAPPALLYWFAGALLVGHQQFHPGGTANPTEERHWASICSSCLQFSPFQYQTYSMRACSWSPLPEENFLKDNTANTTQIKPANHKKMVVKHRHAWQWKREDHIKRFLCRFWIQLPYFLWLV